MKKSKILLILSLCVMLLVGCSSGGSKSSVLQWDYGVISRDGVTLDITSYDGYSAECKTDEYSIEYYTCEGPTGCPHKVVDVASDIMTSYNGTKYFTAFFDTVMQMYYCYDSKNNQWNEGKFGVNGDASYPVATMASLMEPVLKELRFDGSITQVKINDSVLLDVSSGSFNVKNDYVVIPGYLKLATDDGSITFDQTQTIGDVTVAYTSSAKYNYYKYKDVVIQAAAGIDLTQYITFIGE